MASASSAVVHVCTQSISMRMRYPRPLFVVATALLLVVLQPGGCHVGAFVATRSSTTPPSPSSSSIASASTGTGIGTGIGTGRTCCARAAAAGCDTSDDEDDHLPTPQDGPGRAYRQQTPHSGRHFFPSHPSYHDRTGSHCNYLCNLIQRPNSIRKIQSQ